MSLDFEQGAALLLWEHPQRAEVTEDGRRRQQALGGVVRNLSHFGDEQFAVGSTSCFQPVDEHIGGQVGVVKFHAGNSSRPARVFLKPVDKELHGGRQVLSQHV